MPPSHTLGDLQIAIMRVLWRDGEASVAQVHAALSDERPRALTTIATMLAKMEKKGVVRHRAEGRQFLYTATVSERDVTRSMVAELTERLFEGSAAALVGHLLTEQEIDADELLHLRALIEDAEDGRAGR